MISLLNEFIRPAHVVSPKNGKIILDEVDSNGVVVSSIHLKASGKTLVLKFDNCDYSPFFDRTKQGVGKMCDYLIVTPKAILFIELKSNHSNEWAHQIYNGLALFSYIEKVVTWFKPLNCNKQLGVLFSHKGIRPSVKAGSFSIDWNTHVRGFTFAHLPYIDGLKISQITG
jgi:hypothetical protein